MHTSSSRVFGLPRPTVLVVEDDAPLRALITEVLREDLGMTAAEAADGRAAVLALAAARPDLVVLDLGMPDEDGFVVLRWLASRPPATRPPVLCITAEPSAERAVAVRVGCTACLAKPFDPSQLVVAARTLLAGGRSPGEPEVTVDASRPHLPGASGA